MNITKRIRYCVKYGKKKLKEGNNEEARKALMSIGVLVDKLNVDIYER